MKKSEYKNIGTEPWSSLGKKKKGDTTMYRALKKRARNILRTRDHRDGVNDKISY